MVITIASAQDRKTVAAILVENGYLVRKIKVKEGNTPKIQIEAVKDIREIRDEGTKI